MDNQPGAEGAIQDAEHALMLARLKGQLDMLEYAHFYITGRIAEVKCMIDSHSKPNAPRPIR